MPAARPAIFPPFTSSLPDFEPRDPGSDARGDITGDDPDDALPERTLDQRRMRLARQVAIGEIRTGGKTPFPARQPSRRPIGDDNAGGRIRARTLLGNRAEFARRLGWSTRSLAFIGKIRGWRRAGSAPTRSLATRSVLLAIEESDHNCPGRAAAVHRPGETALKVLYVSDSLGTPIHARGIFNYSVSLIEILKSRGAIVDLVVEKARGYGLDKRLNRIEPRHTPATNSVQLSEIHRYFNEAMFSFSWHGRFRRVKFLTDRISPATRLITLLKEAIRAPRGETVKNNLDAIDFVMPKSEHLRNLGGFMMRRRFYSSSMRRAVNEMPPAVIDATGYDLAVVDTPHYVSLVGIPPERVLAVIHDLIPLRDPTMDTNWRYLFLKKLKATLALRSNLVFVSEYTRELFHRSFPDYKTRMEIVLYPAIRASLSEMGAPSIGDAASNTDDEYAAAKRADAMFAFDDEAPLPPKWNAELPYFVTAVSDEPRKNVAILVKAIKLLKGHANIVIVGQIDVKRYLGAETKNVPHIHFTGYIPEADKLRIFGGAAGVIVPSFAEGFGIPLVEGAVLGLPVICSDIAVFREVAAENATYFDPYSPASLVHAVEKVLNDRRSSLEKAEALRASVNERFSQAAMARRLTTALAELGLSI
jgi:glycosyltransferase involved in cell wall biosynthesis